MTDVTLEQYRKFVFALGFILLLPALWSFASAIWSAATTGEVLVIGVDLYETSRQMVPWMNGWARFAGPVALAGAIGLRFSGKMPKWFSELLAATGVSLLLFSQWFTSPTGVACWLGAVMYVALTACVDRRLGRLTTMVMLAVTVALLLWLYARKLNF